MTFTYDLATEIGQVRFEIGDHVSTDALLTDEEIQYLLTLEGSVLLAAAHACDQIGHSFARDFNWQADGVKVEMTARAQHWHSLAVTLTARASGSLASIDTIHNDGWQGNRQVPNSQVTEVLPYPEAVES